MTDDGSPDGASHYCVETKDCDVGYKCKRGLCTEKSRSSDRSSPFLAITSAPLDTNSRATSRCPDSEAMYSGEAPLSVIAWFTSLKLDVEMWKISHRVL